VFSDKNISIRTNSSGTRLGKVEILRKGQIPDVEWTPDPSKSSGKVKKHVFSDKNHINSDKFQGYPLRKSRNFEKKTNSRSRKDPGPFQIQWKRQKTYVFGQKKYQFGQIPRVPASEK